MTVSIVRRKKASSTPRNSLSWARAAPRLAATALVVIGRAVRHDRNHGAYRSTGHVAQCFGLLADPLFLRGQTTFHHRLDELLLGLVVVDDAGLADPRLDGDGVERQMSCATAHHDRFGRIENVILLDYPWAGHARYLLINFRLFGYYMCGAAKCQTIKPEIVA